MYTIRTRYYCQHNRVSTFYTAAIDIEDAMTAGIFLAERLRWSLLQVSLSAAHLFATAPMAAATGSASFDLGPGLARDTHFQLLELPSDTSSV
jgi:hypothetical protein